MGDRTGRIRVGYEADFVMVPGDPLQDVSALRNPAGVMVNGTWLGPERLKQLRETAQNQPVLRTLRRYLALMLEK